MNVSGIRPYEGFYEYNSIKINELRNQQIIAAQKAHRQEPSQAEVDAKAKEEEKARIAAQQTYTAFDFAQEYRPDETYELKGVDSDITSLDVEKVMSDLEKDQVLQQYQYFVGDKSGVITKSVHAQQEVVRPTGENFVL